MKIIVDMMGGDNAPLAVLEGAAAAVKEYGVSLIGVGNEELVRKTAAEHNIHHGARQKAGLPAAGLRRER